jgi:hypothetical protein
VKKSTVVYCITTLFLSVSCFCVSGQQPGPSDKGKAPSGYAQGQSADVSNEFPPGWETKSETSKKKWRDEIQRRKRNIITVARKRGMSEMEANSIAEDFEKAARKGVAARRAENLVRNHLKQGQNAQEVSRAVAEESEKIVSRKKTNAKQTQDKRQEQR